MNGKRSKALRRIAKANTKNWSFQYESKKGTIQELPWTGKFLYKLLKEGSISVASAPHKAGDETEVRVEGGGSSTISDVN